MANMDSDKRGDGEAGLHGVVLERHLEEERKGDHRSAQGDLLEHLLGDADAEVQVREELRVEQGGLAASLALDEPVGERREGDRAHGDDETDELAAFLPDEDPQHDPAHAHDGQDGAHHVDLAGPRVGHVLDETDLGQHDGDDHDLETEADPPRQERGDEPAEERAHRGGDGRRCADQRVGLPLGGAREVAVDERLHRGQQQRGAEPAGDRPEDDDRREALGEHHGEWRRGRRRTGRSRRRACGR